MPVAAIRQSQSISADKSGEISALERAGYWLAFTLLICLRMPNIVLRSRFWAEEGSIFFMRAWHLPWQDALFAPYYGYLNITANLAAFLASHLVPLEFAPRVTTFCALVIQTFPAVLLLISDRPWLKRRALLIAALLIIATQPLSEEVWLSSIGSQCHLNLCIALILALEPMKGWRGIFERALLILAPLSGPGGSFLLPFFVLRAFVDKSWERAKQAAILAAATAVQLLFFYSPQARPLGIGVKFLLDVFFVKHMLVPMLGRAESKPISTAFFEAAKSGHAPTLPMVAAFVVLISLLGIYILQKNKDSLWLFTSAVFVASLSYYGALNDHTWLVLTDGSQRYSFAPNVMLALALLCLWGTSTGLIKQLARALTIWILVIGVHEFFWTPSWSSCGPSWRREVQLWRADHTYALRIWPDDLNWKLRLDPELDGKKQEVLKIK